MHFQHHDWWWVGLVVLECRTGHTTLCCSFVSRDSTSVPETPLSLTLVLCSHTASGLWGPPYSFPLFWVKILSGSQLVDPCSKAPVSTHSHISLDRCMQIHIFTQEMPLLKWQNTCADAYGQTIPLKHIDSHTRSDADRTQSILISGIDFQLRDGPSVSTLLIMPLKITVLLSELLHPPPSPSHIHFCNHVH